MVQALILLAIVSLASAVSYDNNPVRIVGAGPAGLVAATSLQKKGYKTVIFDEHKEIGGKCQAYYEG